ncbi:uncharacterized protein F5891DRAFT_213684 [Suillus fuscotomentosus]|uniref:Uncharacterized protein n=1 Tax=Suillus fuscotomentosus TaxID=1912939 RepID=A0AAD4HSV7_9AGAM|nr:uncharacterized protein F5891DRAFT_213684 [Suillus fuscotomentosus]KAG1907783.1 hypothetical protein F5891DRAFT_213684 [Suillus fuscotomentosus]
MTLSTAMTITARVAVTGFLSLSCFKRAVVDNTAQVLSKAEKTSAGLVVYSVCLSTITLVLAADKAAQRILSNDPKHRPATSKDDNDDSLPSIHDTITSLAPQPVEPSHLQPSLSPSQSHLIESAETISVPIYTCTPNEKTTVKPYNLQPSLNPSLLRLIESTEITSAPIMGSNICTPCITLTSPDLYCKRLSIDSSTTLVPHDDDSVTHVFSDDDASDANDCESFCDESTIHEDDRSEPQPQEDHALEPMFVTLIAKMTALTLDDPPRLSKLRPLILVDRRHKVSTIHCAPLPAPAYSVDALARRLEAPSLSDTPSTDPGVVFPEPRCSIDALTRNMEVLFPRDRPSSTSKLKPLILVTKHATPHFKLAPVATSLLRHPRRAKCIGLSH